MAIKTVDDKLFRYLMTDLLGGKFESLAKKLHAEELGEEFVPLGGTKDGGSDGFLDIHCIIGKKPSTFYQFSTTGRSGAEKKIKDTIAALQKAGRSTKQLIYVTNASIPKQDIIRQRVFEEQAVLLTVKDADRIQQLVNSDAAVNKVFWDFFAPEVIALKHSAENLKGSVNEFVKDPTVFAFLDYELKDRFSKDVLQDRVLDSLIYWALRETDPDEDIFMTKEEIHEAIDSVFAEANSVLLPRLAARLEVLSRKQEGEDRIRHHRKFGKYCLPFDMRKRLAERSLDEAQIQEEFNKSIAERLNELYGRTIRKDWKEICAPLVFNSVHAYFVEQGLILAAYLENRIATISISDQIVERQVEDVLAKTPGRKNISPEMIKLCLGVLRGIFYRPNKIERNYLGYLSRTSLLVMTMRKSPRMLEYFNKMGGNFRLFVGTDLLVKVLSEQQLPEDQRHVDLLLKACSDVGATLVLTEPVLEEVVTHLHAVDLEYRNHYAQNESYLKRSEIEECDRILIRSYYFAWFEGKKIGWDKYLYQFLDPVALRSKSEKARSELAGFLIQRFRMKYLNRDELEEGVNQELVAALADKLIESRAAKNEELSKNDALMIYAVYAQRARRKESAIYDGFGIRTWWLTKETRVLKFTGDLVSKECGVHYIMRPEFILNFIALAPAAAKVRKSFRELLPTTVGLQLGEHLKPEIMHQLLAGTEEWADLSQERRAVIIEEKVNRLKFDRFKKYTQSI